MTLFVRYWWLFTVVACILQAQDPRGIVRGRVSDKSGAVVPNAGIKLSSVESGVSLSATTNEAGNYSVPFVLPGFYNIEVEASGFKQYRQTGVQVRVGETIDVNVSMEIGGVTERVEVTAETPLLDTAGASLGRIAMTGTGARAPSWTTTGASATSAARV